MLSLFFFNRPLRGGGRWGSEVILLLLLSEVTRRLWVEGVLRVMCYKSVGHLLLLCKVLLRWLTNLTCQLYYCKQTAIEEWSEPQLLQLQYSSYLECKSSTTKVILTKVTWGLTNREVHNEVYCLVLQVSDWLCCPQSARANFLISPIPNIWYEIRETLLSSIYIQCSTAHRGTKLCLSWSPVQNKKSEWCNIQWEWSKHSGYA